MSTNPYDATASETTSKAVRRRVGVALVCSHISAVLYLPVGLTMPVLLTFDEVGNEGEPDPVATSRAGACLFAFCALIAAGVEFVAYGVHKRRFWGWVAGLIVFGMYAPSLFFPLRVLGLWRLLATGSRAEFGIGGEPGRC